MTTRRLRTRLADRIATLFTAPEPIIVTAVRASRAIFIAQDVQEVEIKFMTEGDLPITFRMTPRLAHDLIIQLSTAYTAINPPINSRGMGQASWQGME